MHLKSILNFVQPHQGFVYGAVTLRRKQDKPFLDIEIRPRKNRQPVCSKCGRPGPGYDTLPVRRCEFVPLWGIAVFFLYAIRRVSCPTCGVKVEQVPWAAGKNHLTTTYAWFLARWARRLSWKEVGQVFQTSWDNFFRSVKMAVDWGLAHRNLDNVTAIGIDEIAWKKGHKYLTLVYQIDAGCKRLLMGGQGADTEDVAAVLQGVWQRADSTASVHLQRHVATVSEDRRRGCRQGPAYHRPVPCHDPLR